MKFILAVFAALFLASCATKTVYVPTIVKQPLPLAPDVGTCGDLKQIPLDAIQLSTVLSVVSENYAQYHTCRASADAWTAWYAAQQKLQGNDK